MAPTDQSNAGRSIEAKVPKMLWNAAVVLSIALYSLSFLLASKSVPPRWEFLGEIGVITLVAPSLLLIMLRYPILYMMALVCVLLYLALIIADFALCYKYAGLVGADGKVIHDGFISVYFSAITFTTVGYGDFVPANDAGRALAACEGLFGYLFLGIFIAKVVNMFAIRSLK